MTDDIKLPPLPEYPEWLPDEVAPQLVMFLKDIQLEAIKADRQQRGEPVAYAVFADNGNIRIWQHEPLDWPEAVPLYSAPQPAAPAQEPSDDPNTSPTSGKGPFESPSDLVASIMDPSDDIDIEDVRQYLEAWGCLAHPGVVALLARYGNHHVEQPSAAVPKFGEEE